MEKRETMATFKTLITAGLMVLGVTGTAMAQVSAAELELIHQRQQIATMENVLQQAVLHGADNVYAQFRSVFQDRPRLGSQPRASGFTIPGYGTVFLVDVPTMQLPLLWELVARDAEYQRSLLQLQGMRTRWSSMSPGRERDQLLENISRIENQLGMGNSRGSEAGRNGPNGVPAVPAGIPGGVVIEQKDADDPETVYSREVKTSLMDAMLNSTQGLRIGPDEWLTVMAMARETNNAAPGQSVDSSRGIIRVKGSVLAAYRAGTITQEEARKQVEVLEQ
jgi:hypothetical protein